MMGHERCGKTLDMFDTRCNYKLIELPEPPFVFFTGEWSTGEVCGLVDYLKTMYSDVDDDIKDIWEGYHLYAGVRHDGVIDHAEHLDWFVEGSNKTAEEVTQL